MLKIKKTPTETHFDTLDLNRFKDKAIFPEKVADSQHAIQELKGKLKFPRKP